MPSDADPRVVAPVDEWEVECPRCGQVLAECSCPREDADDEWPTDPRRGGRG